MAVFSAIALAAGGGILGGIAAGAVAGAVVGGVASAIKGGNILKGALTGGLVGGVLGGVGSALTGATSFTGGSSGMFGGEAAAAEMAAAAGGEAAAGTFAADLGAQGLYTMPSVTGAGGGAGLGLIGGTGTGAATTAAAGSMDIGKMMLMQGGLQGLTGIGQGLMQGMGVEDQLEAQRASRVTTPVDAPTPKMTFTRSEDQAMSYRNFFSPLEVQKIRGASTSTTNTQQRV